jgi:hypothetical protein
MPPTPEAARPVDVFPFDHVYTVPETGPVKGTADVKEPLHADCPAGGDTDGVGSTVNVKRSGRPAQPLADGTTATTADSDDVPPLVAVKGAMPPTPEAASPTPGSVLDQLNAVPTTGPVNETAVDGDPAHTDWSGTGQTAGVGLAVIVNPTGVPTQPPADGVTPTVATTTDGPALATVNAPMPPVPDEASPMPGAPLDHAYDVPATGPVNAVAAARAPLHNTWLAGTDIVGVGSTDTVKPTGGPAQPLADGVTDTTPDIGDVPPLVPVKGAMAPVPDDESPIEGSPFTQPNDVPETGPLNVTAEDNAPSHKDWLATADNDGVG